ncbi:MAG: Mut7-C ubiquitin/RNAse domain-containing protein [Chloroflexi bacterium]|nr:Mut7-C ubiquitin/RNAse domain-containing protein [Chloroflexota bacterium]
MKIYLRFYGDLNFFLPASRRQRTYPVEIVARDSIKDLIESQGIPHTEIDFILVNGSAVGFDTIVAENDRISVYPYSENLPIPIEQRVSEPYPGEPRFVLDVHLGRLAVYLRLLGFDTLYFGDMQDEDLAEISAREGRILLSRDRGLLKRKIVRFGRYIHSTWPHEQLVEVARRYQLLDQAHPFTRCTVCNGSLMEVDIHAVESEIPAETRTYIDRCWRCKECGKVYWKGSHTVRIERLFAEISTLVSVPSAKSEEMTD